MAWLGDLGLKSVRYARAKDSCPTRDYHYRSVIIVTVLVAFTGFTRNSAQTVMAGGEGNGRQSLLIQVVAKRRNSL